MSFLVSSCDELSGEVLLPELVLLLVLPLPLAPLALLPGLVLLLVSPLPSAPLALLLNSVLLLVLPLPRGTVYADPGPRGRSCRGG